MVMPRTTKGLAGAVILAIGLLAACEASAPLAPAGHPPIDSAHPPPAPAPLAIDSDEVARRLAVLVWNQPADDAFQAQVAAAAPASNNAVAELALRMLEDPRARPGVAAFFRWWLESDRILETKKDPAFFASYTAELRQAMAAEGPAFGVHVTLDGDHRFPTLLTAPFSVINEDLAAIYNLAGVTGPTLRVMTLNEDRSGIITQPGMLALGASATRASASARGSRILRILLCADVPSVAGEEAGEPPQDSTNRAWILAGTASSSCAPCHAVMDPIGFGLGNFDAIGRFSTTEQGQLVDVSGRLPASPTSIACNGPVQLAWQLAVHPEAHACFADQWLRYALGRALTPADDPSRTSALARFTESRLDIRTLIGAVATSDSFLAP